jgi:hypothetical protein
MREAPSTGRQPPCPEQLGVPRRRSRGAWIELVEQRWRARDPPAHPCATEVGMAAEPNQPAGRAAAFRRDRQPPRRGEVERAGVAPQLANDGGEAGASYPLLHRP